MRRLFVLGLSHRTAPLEIREKFYIPQTKIPGLLQALTLQGILEEGVLLSTCNRTELYAVTSTADDPFRLFSRFLSEWFGLSLEESARFWYCHRQEAAVHHLFRVTSGLDSMIMGETEVQGQVKRAFEESRRVGSMPAVAPAAFGGAMGASSSLRTST